MYNAFLALLFLNGFFFLLVELEWVGLKLEWPTREASILADRSTDVFLRIAAETELDFSVITTRATEF